MRSDLTDITLVVDRSGSMQAIREDAQGGVNALMQQQVKEPGEATLTLVQFDTEYEVVHSGVAIEDVPEYELVPHADGVADYSMDYVAASYAATSDKVSRMRGQRMANQLSASHLLGPVPLACRRTALPHTLTF